MSLAAVALLRLLRLYRTALSPRLPRLCIHHPSCSRYAEEAVRVHGAVRGVRLAAARLWRCRPGSPGGRDPVPPRVAKRG